MTGTPWLTWSGIVFTAAVLVAATVPAQTTTSEEKLPAPVGKTFRTAFPKAEIQKLDVEKEEGVDVYDFEFKDGELEKETDIAADGTMLEITIVVAPEAVPAAALKAIQNAAKTATIGRLEHIESTYETSDGKLMKLPKVETKFAAELAKGNQIAEVVVTPAGTVIDAPKWVVATK